MNISRFEDTCIMQTARTCFYSSRLDGFVFILRWPLSDIIGNNNGKLDIMTTKSNHCQLLNCAIGREKV